VQTEGKIDEIFLSFLACDGKAGKFSLYFFLKCAEGLAPKPQRKGSSPDGGDALCGSGSEASRARSTTWMRRFLDIYGYIIGCLTQILAFMGIIGYIIGYDAEPR
jgi:hypothetical protein